MIQPANPRLSWSVICHMSLPCLNSGQSESIPGILLTEFVKETLFLLSDQMAMKNLSGAA